MLELCEKSAVKLRKMMGSKDISPVELLEGCISRIEAVDGNLNAIVTRAFDQAIVQAKKAEEAILAGEFLGFLHGLPVGIKDLETTSGIRTTFGSNIYKENIPTEDQSSVTKIKQAGGIIIGKTNTPEFGAGANTRNFVFGATGNPFDPDKTCGGSSGGSAVALATNMVPLASGSDYGGSLRTPAAFCGIVGFRPSAGLVASEQRPIGLLPFSVLGPMARNVDDVFLLLKAQAGSNPYDPFSLSGQKDLSLDLEMADLSGKKVLISEDLDGAPLSKKYKEIFCSRIELIKNNFSQADWGDPNFAEADNCFEVLRGVNFVAAHGERVKNYRDKLGPNVIENVERGLQYNLKDVAQAHLQQTNIAKSWITLFNDYDVIIAPATSVTPFPFSDWSVEEIDGRKMQTYMEWLAITYRPTMAMACGIVLPCGLDHQNMPFGIQLLAAPGKDRHLLEVAKAVEKSLSQHNETRRPVPILF